ncbi:MAG: phosphatase PAP2 family protein [Actinobacteria bacterium]|nr:phosphatase PAP2 family protein [Actinomycetota bacterium]
MSLSASPLTDLDESADARLDEIDDADERPLPTTEKRTWHAVGRQAAIIGLALVAYLTVRALTVGSETAAFDNANLLLDFERALGFDWEAGIQQAALDRGWVVTGANWFYAFAFWPILIATLVYTWFWQRPLFRRFRNSLFVSGVMGLAIFAAFPVAPPRFLSGYVDTVSVAARHQYIARPGWLINENAALPSFHVGWVALSAVLLFSVVKAPIWRFVILIPPLTMAATVVVTGNHYVIDIVAGVAVSLAALLVIVWFERKPTLASN